MLFVTRNWTQDEAKIERMFKTIKRHEAPVWIVNFLEGTRATPQKLKDVCISKKKGGFDEYVNYLPCSYMVFSTIRVKNMPERTI